jgi:hypothetical protein
MPSPPPERERNVFHYLLVRAYQTTAVRLCPVFVLLAEYNMSNEIRTKVSPCSTYRTMPGPSTLKVLRILPRSDLRRITIKRKGIDRRCTYPGIRTMSKAMSKASTCHHCAQRILSHARERTGRQRTLGCRSCFREVLGAIEA